MSVDIPKHMDDHLYKKAKQIVTEQYGSKTSAYRSMAIVKKYKELGGKYHKPKDENIGVTRWLNEKWIQVGPYLKNGSHVKCGLNLRRAHACRPSIRVSKETPITIQEVVRKHGYVKTLEKSGEYRVDWVRGNVSSLNTKK
jgi:hypothetical protein